MEIDELFQQGCSELDIGKNTEAIALLSQVLEQQSDHYEAMNKLGVAYARTKDFVNAQDCFEKALDLNEAYGPAWVNLGNLYNESRDVKTAEEFYREAIKRDPDYYLSYHNLAVICKNKGEYELYVKNMKKYKRMYKRHLDQQDKRDGIKNRRTKKIANIVLVAGAMILLILFIKGI